jgi:S1-C subfamily serine protease
MSTAKTRPRASRSPPAQPLPPNAIEKIRCVPGNDLCLDCRAAEPDWADVQHGSLHCIQCAGRHRGLGVKVSVTRSLTMDNWTEANLLAMLLGGNKQLRTFFETHTIENSDIEVLYRTKQASYYREQLQAQVAKMALQRRKSKSPPPISMPATPEPPQKNDGFARDFDVALRTPSLGASLTRALPPPGVTSPIQGNGSMALVTKVVTNGPAHSAGVRVGDYVVALNGRPALDYDELVALFARAPRPLRLTVRRFGGDAVSGASAAGADEAARDAMRASPPAPAPPTKSAAFGGAPPPSKPAAAAEPDAPETAPPPPAAPPPPPDSPPTPKRKPPEPPSEVLEASFGPGPLGLTVDRNINGAPCVTRVAADGQAANAGVRVGDVVIALNGTREPAYEAVVRDLPALPRPTLLKFRRPQQIVIDAALAPTKSPLKPPPVTRARGPAFNGKGSKVFAEELDDGSTTKIGLPSPDDANEYDVTFSEGPLGFRLEERGGLVAVSLVTSVDAAGQAAAAGVRAGDVVLGVNGERYLSHAHTAATLKHGRRPVELRLRHSD